MTNVYDMKVLFICNRSPFCPDMGSAQRTAVILNAFVNNGCCVDIAYVGSGIGYKPQNLHGNINIVLWNENHKWSVSRFSELKSLFLVAPHPYSNELGSEIRRIVNQNNYDFVFCRYIKIAFLAGLFSLNEKILLDIDDLPEIAFRVDSNRKSLFRNIYYGLKKIRLQINTRSCIKRSYCAFLPNKSEANDYKVTYLPNISTIHADNNTFEYNRHALLFIGFMSWPANYMGVDLFISNCWLKILTVFPQVSLYIAGKGLPNEYLQKWSKYKNIEYLGYVDDIYNFYHKGNIVICPIYSGAGTNIKVIEAMSMGKSCVLSLHGTRGFEDILQHEKNIMISNNIHDFSDNVIQLLQDDNKCKEIGSNAQRTAKCYFSQKSIDEIIRKSISLSLEQ